MSEPKPVAPSDAVTLCPLCSTDKPAVSVRLLRTVVRRKGRYEGVINGEQMQCLECSGSWAYDYSRGVFWRRSGTQTVEHQHSTQDHSKPPPAVRLTPRERKAGV